MRTLVILSTFFIWAIGAKAAEMILPQSENKVEDVSISSHGFKLFGSMQLPETKKKLSVLLLISGSGPTDRNGNQPGLTNNSFKYLAEELAKQGIASLRYDKRGIAMSATPDFSEAKILFDDYVSDAANWVRYLKTQKKFDKVYVAGMSEGSLIGMLAALQAGADGFISLNGPGRPADDILIKQIERQGTPEQIVKQVKEMIQQVKAGEKVSEVPEYLMALFRPDIQPYLKSWFGYNPAIEIAKLNVPVLIIQGENDIQVELEDAQLLKSGNAKAKLKLIKGMNHILKDAPKDLQSNYASYSKPELPLNITVVPEIVTFIQQ